MTRLKRLLAPLALVATLAALPAVAQPKMDKRLYDLGYGICADISNGALDVGGAKPYLEQVDTYNVERSEFCHCVGQEFGLNEAQKARMTASEGDAAADAMVQIILSNMAICAPGHRIYADLITSKDDMWQCRQVMDGSRRIRGLKLQPVLTEMQENKKDVDDICGCAAGFITYVEDLIDAKPVGLATPSAAYQMQMATAINLCLVN